MSFDTIQQTGRMTRIARLGRRVRRHLRVARVIATGRVKDPNELPPLYEPALIAMSPH
jgi:hypothetical protein